MSNMFNGLELKLKNISKWKLNKEVCLDGFSKNIKTYRDFLIKTKGKDNISVLFKYLK